MISPPGDRHGDASRLTKTAGVYTRDAFRSESEMSQASHAFFGWLTSKPGIESPAGGQLTSAGPSRADVRLDR
jgi:hypothetical protein